MTLDQHALALAVAAELRAIPDQKARNLTMAFAGRTGEMRDRNADAVAELAELVASLDWGDQGLGASVAESGGTASPKSDSAAPVCKDCGKPSVLGLSGQCEACLEEGRERADEDWFFDMDGKP